MTDYMSKTYDELTKIYHECMLDERFPAIHAGVLADGFKPGTHEFYVAIAQNCDLQALI